MNAKKFAGYALIATLFTGIAFTGGMVQFGSIGKAILYAALLGGGMALILGVMLVAINLIYSDGDHTKGKS